MTPQFAQRSEVALRKKQQPFPLQAIDGKPVTYNQGVVAEETEEIPLRIGRYRGKVQYDITEAPGSDVVLGLPWLKEANPYINWKEETIWFEGSPKPTPLSVVRDALDMVGVCAMTYAETEELIAESPNEVQVLWAKGNNQDASPEVDIPEEYRDLEEVFKEEGDDEALPAHQPWDHEIKLLPGTKPTKQPVRPLSAQKLEILRKYVDGLMKKGLIRQSESPAGYPVVFAPKGKDDWRVCIDYRGLNNITVKNSYPLPLISEMQDRLQGAKWFTKFDIPGAYNRIRMKEGEEWKTAFRTRFGHFEYLVMPFGLTNAPATFQAFINNVLRQYLDVFVVVYLDDILVYSKTIEEHVQHVRQVLTALRDSTMKVKLSKSEFHKHEVQFLGYVVSQDGLKMDQSKISTILDWPIPTTVREVQSFLGFANFYRRFIERYSQTAHALTELTHKDRPFAWTPEAQTAFDELKKRFTTQPILIMFDPEKPITVETDASDKALGACLSQPGPQGKLQPVAYHSRKMTPAELRYDIHDKELLAIVDAFRQWKVYLEGSKHTVTVFTDHKNLIYFTTTKELNRRQVRWYEDLATFNFRIQYRKGSENDRADALSRRTDYMKGEVKEKQAVLRQDADGTMTVNRIAATFSVHDDALRSEIRAALEHDATAKAVCNDPEGHERFETHDGLLHFEGRMYVPTRMRNTVIEAYHDPQVYGHPGVDRMVKMLQREYYFPGMRKSIEDYIRCCNTCRRSKHDKHKPYGLLQPLNVPTRPWQAIALDFIVKLPASVEPTTEEVYDGILVVVDRFSKMGHFIPYKETFSATDVAYLMTRNVFAYHGLPETMTSDRDSLFTSNFWQALMQQLGVKQRMSTAFHPQTDGQTERLNQTLEQYLRCYVNEHQTNWIELLPVAQIAYNAAPATLTGLSPLEVCHGIQIHSFAEGTPGTTPAANEIREQWKTLFESLRLDLQFFQARMTRYANERRIEGPILKEGDKVYLVRRNIKSDKPSKKLDAVKLGPFKIKKKKGPVSFELELPKNMRVHPVFHISLLEPATPDAMLQTTAPSIDPEYQEPIYAVETIIGDKLVSGQRLYHVKWKGYSHTENTWEPEAHFNSKAPIQQYRRSRRK